MPDPTPAPTGTDDLAAVLDDIRKRWECWGDGNDVPRLLAVADAVLALHTPGYPVTYPEPSGQPTCGVCHAGGWDWEPEKWPCPTVRAVMAALLGTEADRV